MENNQQDKTESKLIATENTSRLPPFSHEDEKEAQKELDRLRKRLRENENEAVKVNRKLNRKRSGFEDKTLWDKLNLFGTLAIPIVIAIATIAFGIIQYNLADQQHLSDQKLADQQHQADQKQALDQQQAAILQTYIDNIQDLLLNHKLLSSRPTDAVAILARARTLTALPALDPERKDRLLIFLYEAKLIGFENTNLITHPHIIDLSDADLTSADLGGATLSGANLSSVNLSNAILGDDDLRGADISDAVLRGADLNFAILSSANLSDADLDSAYLSSANLSDAFLTFADLSNDDLRGIHLTGAHLGGADLAGAINLTQQQLDQVYSCKDAILPPGLTCHHNQ